MFQSTCIKRAVCILLSSASLFLFISQVFKVNVKTDGSFLPIAATLFEHISTSLVPVDTSDTSEQVFSIINLTTNNFSPDFSEKCARIINGSAPQATIQKAINVSNHQYLYSTQHHRMVSNNSSGCENYFAFHGYYNKWKPVNLIEEKFPVAFGMLIYHQVDQFEQLFRAIYRPNNFYCIHVDDSAKKDFKDAVSGILSLLIHETIVKQSFRNCYSQKPTSPGICS